MPRVFLDIIAIFGVLLALKRVISFLATSTVEALPITSGGADLSSDFVAMMDGIIYRYGWGALAGYGTIMVLVLFSLDGTMKFPISQLRQHPYNRIGRADRGKHSRSTSSLESFLIGAAIFLIDATLVFSLFFALTLTAELLDQNVLYLSDTNILRWQGVGGLSAEDGREILAFVWGYSAAIHICNRHIVSDIKRNSMARTV